MKSTALKCPSCGSALQVRPGTSATTCIYCRTVVSLDDGVVRVRVEHTGAVSVDGIATLSNLLLRGEQGMTARDYQLAFQYFTQALDTDATSFDAWHGCIRATTQNFTYIDLSWVPLLGIHGLGSITRNAQDMCPTAMREMLNDEIERTVEILDNIHRDLYNREQRAKIMRGVRIGFPVVLLLLILVSFGLSISGSNKLLLVGFGSIIVLGIWVNYFNPRNLRKSKPKVGQVELQSNMVLAVSKEIESKG